MLLMAEEAGEGFLVARAVGPANCALLRCYGAEV